MGLPLKSSLNEDTGPIPESLFKELKGAGAPNAVDIASSLPEAQRAQLAVFCYRKRHLHELGLRIASTCEINSLLQAAGTGGEVIFNQSRDPDATLAKEAMPHAHSSPKPITLATCANVNMGPPMDQDMDDDWDEED